VAIGKRIPKQPFDWPFRRVLSLKEFAELVFEVDKFCLGEVFRILCPPRDLWR